VNMNELNNEGYLAEFRKYLIEDEKSVVTIEKYLRDTGFFLKFADGCEITKDLVLSFKKKLIDSGKYKVGSINSILSSVRSFLGFISRSDCFVKAIKTQKQLFCSPEKELTKEEYLRLVDASKNDSRLCMILQTICSTGIRVSELRYFTVEAIHHGEINVHCKNKTRTILIPGKLRKLLFKYCKSRHIVCGVIFRTKSGKAIDRSNLWSMMKRICCCARVAPSKVFPHNLRKLFARTFYRAKHDIATLADVLGHSSINTTRIYIMTTFKEHLAEIDKMNLVVEVT